jgi:hypothetical protein
MDFSFDFENFPKLETRDDYKIRKPPNIDLKLETLSSLTSVGQFYHLKTTLDPILTFSKQIGKFFGCELKVIYFNFLSLAI